MTYRHETVTQSEVHGILRFCASNLLTQGSVFHDVLIHAKLVLRQRLLISYDPLGSQTLVAPTLYSVNSKLSYIDPCGQILLIFCATKTG